MFNGLRKLASNPLVKRFVMWVTPIIAAWALDKITNPSNKQKGSKPTSQSKK